MTEKSSDSGATWYQLSPGVTYSPEDKVVFVSTRQVLEAAGLPVVQETMLAVFQGIEGGLADLARQHAIPIEGAVLIQEDAPSMQDFINHQEAMKHGTQTGNE